MFFIEEKVKLRVYNIKWGVNMSVEENKIIIVDENGNE